MPDGNEVSSRRQRFLVGRAAGAAPMGMEENPLQVVMESLNAAFQRTSGVDLLAAPDIPQPKFASNRPENPVLVIEVDEATASALQADPQFAQESVIEPDRDLVPLEVDTAAGSASDLEVFADPSLLPLGTEFVVRIVVRDQEDPNLPIAGADVTLIGQMFFPWRARTDDNGRVELRTFGESPATLKTLMVRPSCDYWSRSIDRPDIDPDADNVVSVRKLGTHETLTGFPDRQLHGWGQKAMRLDRVGNRNGQGVSIGVIDSGIETDHADLEAEGGFNFIETEPNPDLTWKEDSVGHGSHCTGVIAAPNNGRGIVGFAPDAEGHGYKIFPGGKTSWLIGALQRCIQDEIDVVNLSLGMAEGSELLLRQIRLAKQNGVACIAAAGNTAGPVMFPAAYQGDVLAVAAIGKSGTFPDDSTHAGQVGQHESTDGQYFSARFTCFGDQVDVCAPGVAVVSTVPPPDCYAAWDGTSMACPHVAGLAALVLAHRDEAVLQQRNGARVDRLFEILTESADDLGLPAQYQGAGLPNALKALDISDVGGDGTPVDVVPGDEQPGDEESWERVAQLLDEVVAIVRKQVGP